MDSTAYLLLTVLFSSIGMGYFIYGKRQGKASALIGGIGLMLYSFFVSSILLLTAIGILFMALPYFLEF